MTRPRWIPLILVALLCYDCCLQVACFTHDTSIDMRINGRLEYAWVLFETEVHVQLKTSQAHTPRAKTVSTYLLAVA